MLKQMDGSYNNLDTSKKRALVFVDHRIKNYVHRTAIFKLRLNNDNYWEIEDSMLLSTS